MPPLICERTGYLVGCPSRESPGTLVVAIVRDPQLETCREGALESVPGSTMPCLLRRLQLLNFWSVLQAGT